MEVKRGPLQGAPEALESTTALLSTCRPPWEPQQGCFQRALPLHPVPLPPPHPTPFLRRQLAMGILLPAPSEFRRRV